MYIVQSCTNKIKPKLGNESDNTYWHSRDVHIIRSNYSISYWFKSESTRWSLNKKKEPADVLMKSRNRSTFVNIIVWYSTKLFIFTYTEWCVKYEAYKIDSTIRFPCHLIQRNVCLWLETKTLSVSLVHHLCTLHRVDRICGKSKVIPCSVRYLFCILHLWYTELPIPTCLLRDIFWSESINYKYKLALFSTVRVYLVKRAISVNSTKK